MTVREIWTNGLTLDVTGVGYEPAGKIINGGEAVGANELREYDSLWRAASFCNTSRLIPPDDRRVWSIWIEERPGRAEKQASLSRYSEGPRTHLSPFESQENGCPHPMMKMTEKTKGTENADLVPKY
jgi:hypothetical protein